MKIGELVQTLAPDIFAHCEENPAELERLTSLAYCKATFGLSFPFCQSVGELQPNDRRRYWSTEYRIGSKRVRVCNHWFETQRSRFVSYASKLRIVVDEVGRILPSLEPMTQDNNTFSRPRGAAKGRHGVRHIGNLQNAVVRAILSKLGDEQFGPQEWADTKSFFGGACAYCGVATTAPEIDHAIPITMAKLGEHRLGNLVPSCGPCNRAKGGKDFVEFLGAETDKTEQISLYMKSRNYTPLEQNAEITKLLENARQEVDQLVTKFAQQANAIITSQSRTRA